ncbi:DnaJ domain-containing protein [Biscogniauxia marginata]|nr:DnaJ domain-containing protein [Biscogniauxia marginata]
MPLTQRSLVLKSSLSPPSLLAGPERRCLHVPISQEPQQRQRRQNPQCEIRRLPRRRDGAVGIGVVRAGVGLAITAAAVFVRGGDGGVCAAAGRWRREQQQHHRRLFHSTCSRADEAIDNSRNHYETLKLHPGATPAEIKKAFYTLSKAHHPDAHAHRSSTTSTSTPTPTPTSSSSSSSKRSTSKSSQRFMRISEAYSVLSIPARRSAYDRDVLRLHSSSSSSASASSPSPHHAGSYSSTNPAGGRPASGLSRRRATYQGPPPSFYRSGGWGGQAGKRRAAHEESTGTSFSSSSSSTPSYNNNNDNSAFRSSTGSGSGSQQKQQQQTLGGMGPGQDPFGHRDDVPHFDREAHERTGRHVDRRRAARQQQRQMDSGVAREYQRASPSSVEPEKGVGGMFVIIGGILLFSFLGPFAVTQVWSTGGSGSGNGAGGTTKERNRRAS